VPAPKVSLRGQVLVSLEPSKGAETSHSNPLLCLSRAGTSLLVVTDDRPMSFSSPTPSGFARGFSSVFFAVGHRTILSGRTRRSRNERRLLYAGDDVWSRR